VNVEQVVSRPRNLREHQPWTIDVSEEGLESSRVASVVLQLSQWTVAMVVCRDANEPSLRWGNLSTEMEMLVATAQSHL
jgi:hypothetical protein